MAFGVTSRLLTAKGILDFITSRPLYVIISSTSDVLSCVAFLTLLVKYIDYSPPSVLHCLPSFFLPDSD